MKMKNYRLFILGFVTTSFILLTGFEKPGVNDALPSANEVKKVQSKSKESQVKARQKKTTNKQEAVSALRAKNSAAEEAEFQKPLDLSMPLKDSENAWLTIKQNKSAQRESLNMFASEKNKKPQPLYLDSQMLMSQEPEADKRKSLDGAGIVINLKR